MELKDFILGLHLFVLISYSNAVCIEPFFELNDTNCYFISDDWVLYNEAKEICHLLDSDVYIPPKGNDYNRAGLYHQIRQHLSYDNFWIGVEKKILNYTTYDYNWINGNTGKIMNYTLFPTSWRRSLKVEKKLLGFGCSLIASSINISLDPYQHSDMKALHHCPSTLPQTHPNHKVQWFGTMGNQTMRGQLWKVLPARKTKLRNKDRKWWGNVWKDKLHDKKYKKIKWGRFKTIMAAGNRDYGPHKWTYPDEGEEGYISAFKEMECPNKASNRDEKRYYYIWCIDLKGNNITEEGVLGVVSHNKVKLQNKTLPIPETQKWRRDEADENGWFTFTNPETKKSLTAHTVYEMSIKDKDTKRLPAKVKDNMSRPLWDWMCAVESQGRLRTVWIPLTCSARFGFVCSKKGEKN